MLQKRKVWHLFQALKPEEYREFENWLLGIIRSTQPDLLLFFHALKEADSDRSIWECLYPDQEYRDGRIRFLSHHLSQHLEEFLTWQTFRESSYTYDLYRLKAMNRRGIHQAFNKYYKPTINKWETSSRRDGTYFQARYEAEKEYLTHLISKPAKKSRPDRRAELNEYFNQYWLTELLKSSIDSLRIEQQTGKQLISPLHQEVLSQLLRFQTDFVEMPLVSFLLQLYHCMLPGEGGDIHALVRLLQQEKDKIGDLPVLYSYTTLLLNYLTSKYHHTRDASYLKTSYHLYKWGIEQKIMFIDGHLSTMIYTNFIEMGLSLGYVEESKQHIEKFRSLLPPNNQEEPHLITQAQYFFKVGDYRKVLQIANRRFLQESYEIKARLLMIQAGYEKGDKTGLSNTLKGLKAYIQKHPPKDARTRKSFLQFIRLSTKLAKAYLPKDYQKILDTINEYSSVLKKDWLIAKCQEGIMK